MVGEDQMRARCEVQPAAHVDAGAVEVIELDDQGGGIDHHTRADDGVLAGPQDAAGDQLQDEAVAIVDDGMTGVVAAGATRNVVKRSRHVIDDFAFAFIAPLSAHDYDGFHSRQIPFRAVAAAYFFDAPDSSCW